MKHPLPPRVAERVAARVADRVAAWKLLQYGLIAFPLSFVGLPLYLHAPDFYAVSMNIPIEVIGGALLFLRLFDALQDPLIGSFSDVFYKHRGPIIILGVIMLTTGMWMIFHPQFDFALFWLCLSVLICTTGFSIVSINIQALGGLWCVTADEVPRVMAAREAIGLCGLLVASITPSALSFLLKTSDPGIGFHYLTLGFIPLIVLCTWVFLRWMKSVTIAKPKRELPLSFNHIFSDQKTRLFFGSYLLSTFAASIPATLIIFYVRDYLGAEHYLGLFLILYFLSGAAAMPLWTTIARRSSTIMSWWISMVLACLTFIWAFTLSPGDIIGYGIVCLLSGVAVGANLVLPAAIAANILTEKKHQKAASRYYAFMAFLAKASLALATGIALPLLGLSGYRPGEITTGALIPTAYAIVPCGIQILAISVLWYLVQLEKRKK